MKAQELVDALNALYAIDKKAAADLVGHRVECSESLAESDVPFICSLSAEGKILMGLIGFMNALVADGTGRAAAYYDDDMQLCGFVVVGLPE